MPENKQLTEKPTRRAALKTVAYVVPAVLTLTARPAKARGGSGTPGSTGSTGSGGDSDSSSDSGDSDS